MPGAYYILANPAKNDRTVSYQIHDGEIDAMIKEAEEMVMRIKG
jgi:hypothetical protein